MLMERNGLDRRQPIGRLHSATPRYAVSGLYAASRLVNADPVGSVYDIRTDDAGTPTHAYVEFSGGSLRDWGLQSPRWEQINPADTLTLTHAITYRMYAHEHGDYFRCTACPYTVVPDEFVAGPLTRQWCAEHGYPVGSMKLFDDTHGGVTICRAETPVDGAPGATERIVCLVWH